MSAVSTAAERLAVPEALLCRNDLNALGLPRRAVDTIFRRLPIIQIPGYSRPFVRVSDYKQLLEDSTYRGDRVR